MSKPKTKQTFIYLGGLRKAFSDLDNAIPDSAFDYDLDQSMIDDVWNEISVVEKQIDDGVFNEK
jgi:hypothetical protein